jgi:hypothetical protein
LTTNEWSTMTTDRQRSAKSTTTIGCRSFVRSSSFVIVVHSLSIVRWSSLLFRCWW